MIKKHVFHIQKIGSNFKSKQITSKPPGVLLVVYFDLKFDPVYWILEKYFLIAYNWRWVKLDKPKSYKIKKEDELIDCYLSYPNKLAIQ